MEVKKSLELLDYYLAKKNLKRSFIICGGGALILRGIISRTTKDIDVVAPPIDNELQSAALSVASDLGLSGHWLNCGPESITKDLEADWQKRVDLLFTGRALQVYSLSRQDLIFSKFWALCDRQKDHSDLIAIKPTLDELKRAADYTAKKDGNPSWPQWVEVQFNKLKKDLGHE